MNTFQNVIIPVISTFAWALIVLSSCHWHQHFGIIYILSQISFVVVADILINHGIEIRYDTPKLGWPLIIAGFAMIPLIAFAIL